MKRFLLSAIPVIYVVTLAQAQRLDGYNRFEVFHGNSFFILERPEAIGAGTEFEGFLGINNAATFNVRRYFGVKFDMARYSKSYGVCAPEQSLTAHDCFNPLPGAVVTMDDPRTKTSIYNFMGGIQVKDNGRGTKTFKPFAYLAVGSALTRERVDTYSPGAGQLLLDFKTRSDWGAAGSVGGGLDLRLNDRVDLRVLQLDYHKATIFNRSSDNVRFSFGFVFH